MFRQLRLSLFAIAALAATAPAQGTGSIAGVVTDDRQQPVEGARVTVVGTRAGATTGADGRYRISGIAAGTYDVRAARIGQRPRVMPGVAVRESGETTLDISLTGLATTLAPIVTAASRRSEKITDAPATISVISQEVIDQSIGNVFASALKEVKGLDFIQVGMTAVAINARGFNSSFNNRFLMVEDGRISVLPENGLPVGAFTATPKVDLAGMEVLVGPGSALYGADASNGVLSLRTKDPRESKGSVIELTGGSRSYADIQGRYANVVGNTGFKVSGEYQRADDWENFLCYNTGGSIVGSANCAAGQVREDRLRAPINWNAKVLRGSGAVVQYMGDKRFEVNGGMSLTDGVGQTNVGRNQLSGWKYNVLQARYTTPRWYFNAYRAQSQSGDSYALNRFAGAQLAPANASLSTDSLRSLSDWPSDGRMYAAEVQGNYLVPQLRNTQVIFGGQYRNDVVSSKRQWLTDRNTGKDISNALPGVYAQTLTPITSMLDVVLAGRIDKPDNYERQISPKAGLVFKPANDQALRVTWNRAFKSPTILQTNFFIPDWTGIISIYGNTGGFKTVNAAGDSINGFRPMQPESNDTWEFGYKGVLKNRLYVDGTYFRSKYKNFMSPLSIIGNPFASAAAGGPTFARPIGNDAGIPVNAQGSIVNAAGIAPIVLTYYNLGNATVTGVDLGVNYLATDRVDFRATLSTVGIDTVITPRGASPEATSLNSPGTKWTVGTTARDIIGPLTMGATFRNVNRYYFRSGANTGVIPTFGTLDLSASVRIPSFDNSLVSLGISNLFSCTARKLTYKTGTPQPNMTIATEERGCGFGRRHVEMINMPEIGTMVFLGVRYSR